MIPLVCGDPRHQKAAAEKAPDGGKGASYTRFLFPFAYRPVVDRHPIRDEPCYKPLPLNESDWNRRRRYFTRETADVLFKRARWFAIPQADWENPEDQHPWPRRFKAALHSGELDVELAPPELVLFEWKAGTPKQSAPDLFQTGFLLIEAHFPAHQPSTPVLEDLLVFNERFRYWRAPFPTHAERMRSIVDSQGLLGNSESEAPSELLSLYLDRWLRLLELPLISPDNGTRLRLFPEAWATRARKWWLSELTAGRDEDADPPAEHCLVYADNRAFTWTCALVEAGVSALPTPSVAAGLLAAEDRGYWVKLLNVDAPEGSPEATNRVTAFEREWAADRTYKRWEHFGTLYGFNYHAGAMLAAPIADPPTWLHFREQYLDMVLLLLYLRVTLFRFSRALSDISEEARDARGGWRAERRWRKRFEELRWRFSVFTNLYKFPLVSNQQQAIEMYSLARRFLDVDELFEEVEEEIASSHEFLDVSISSKLNDKVFLLTSIALVLAVVQIATWFFASPETPLSEIATWFEMLLGWLKGAG